MSTLSIHGSQCCKPPRRPPSVAPRWLPPALTGLAALAAAALLVAAGLAPPAAGGVAPAVRTVTLPPVVVHGRRLPPVGADCPVPTEPAAPCPTPVDAGER